MAIDNTWGALTVSLAASMGVVWVMIGWMHRYGLRFNGWTVGVLLLSTYAFARAAWLGALWGDVAPQAMVATLLSTLALRNFFYLYETAKRYPGRQLRISDVQVTPSDDQRSFTGTHDDDASITNSHFIHKGTDAKRALTPVLLFGALVFGGVAGVMAPVAAMAAFLLVGRQWRQTGLWFGVREVLIFCFLCLSGFVIFIAGARSGGGVLGAFAGVVKASVFEPAPREHLFWYPARLLVGLLPWAPLYLFIIIRGFARSKIKSDTARFFLHTTWSMLVVMSLLSSKSTLYLLPVYPFIACLTAALLAKKR